MRAMESGKPKVESRFPVTRELTRVTCFALLSLLAVGLSACRTFEGKIPEGPKSSGDIQYYHRPAEEAANVQHAAAQERAEQADGVAHASHTVRVADAAPRPMPRVMPVAMLQPSEPQGNPVHLYPDEYLFDGGDRAKPIHYDNFRRLGLDTEDTVAEYTTHKGKHKVTHSNRVAVYSPRFAAVRTIDQPEEGTGGNSATSMLVGDKIGGFENRRLPIKHKGRAIADGVRMRARGSGIDADRKDASAQSTTVIAAHGLNSRALENLTIIRSGRFDRSQEAILATGIQATVTWTKRMFPMITATTQGQSEVSARFNPSQYIGSEDMRKTTGKLRIVKVADKQSAQPGEVVNFTIRYDNLGDRELHHITVLDNLTPRLEYVKDSADSDRAGRLVVEENQEGSLVLKFELADPLPGHKGGVVKFQAKVR